MTPLKICFLIMTLWNLAEAQKSFYASRPRSKLLPKYKQNETETTTEGLGNRFGEEDSVSEGSNGINNRNQEFGGTLFNEDQRFLNRVAQWPEDKQPFWFKNRNHISTMRGQERIGGSNGQDSLGTRFNSEFPSPFLGNRQLGNRELGNNQGRADRRINTDDLWRPTRTNFNSQRNRPRFLERNDY